MTCPEDDLPPVPGFIVTGHPLSTIGLDDALVVYEDGLCHRLVSVLVYPDKGIIESLLSDLPEGASVVFDVSRYPFPNELVLH